MCACVKDNTDKNLLSVWRSPRGKEPVGTCRQRIYMTLAIVGHQCRCMANNRWTAQIHPPPHNPFNPFGSYHRMQLQVVRDGSLNLFAAYAY